MARGRIYNNFYTPELWEQVNKENKRILDDFLAEYRQRKKSKEYDILLLSRFENYTYICA